MLQELNSEEKIAQWGKEKIVQDIALKVSGYAAGQPLEFVAEVGAGLANGQVFDKDVMELYKYLKGESLLLTLTGFNIESAVLVPGHPANCPNDLSLS